MSLKVVYLIDIMKPLSWSRETGKEDRDEYI